MEELLDIVLTKRQQKNEETKQKLRHAMNQIMGKYDYNTVTIRNICTVSGVSYGSFYNLFESKEAFLRHYLSYDFTQYMNSYYKRHQEFQELCPIEKSIDVFVCCARYNVEKGLKFISGFYSPHNYTLYTDIEEPDKEYSFTPLLKISREYLTDAIRQGILPKDFDVERAINMFCYLFNGITFNWCISRGKIDMITMTEKILTEYTKTWKSE